ncbi:ERF family protein [Bosea sp. UC22_33]|uniref:ERF family protein n=1 Tax=Bosea sp. UC22_33 TaxID=3350165 RepID=UPI00367280C0
MRRLARKAFAAFISWRARQRAIREAGVLARRAAVVTPEIVARRAEIERRRQTHRPVQHLLDAQRQDMTARTPARAGPLSPRKDRIMSNAALTISEADYTAPAIQPQAVAETTAIISMIERAARDPAVDIDKMERLMLMQERAMERSARAAYAEALALLQPELPSVARNGRIVVTDKADRNKVIQSTAYARWEDINDAIKPALAKHGFSLSFKVGMANDGKITVTGILTHREGHQEETTITLPHDSTGSKNAVQAVG